MNTYKNKLVLEIVKEIKEMEEKKALEEKKIKIRQMLSIISSKENKIEKLKEEIKSIEKEVADLKIQLDKEDFSCLSNAFNLIVDCSCKDNVSCTFRKTLG